MEGLEIASVALAVVALVAAVPLGLSVGRDANARAWRRLWPVVGVIGGISVLLPVGGLAVGLAVFYLAGTVALALSIPARLVHRPWPATEIAVAAALAAPLAGAVILVAQRLGTAPAGGLWWVISTQAGFAAGMWASARAAGPIGQANRLGTAGAAVITWAALVSGILAWWLPVEAAVGGGVLAVAGAVLVALNPARPPEPCSAQVDESETGRSARLGG